MQVMTALDMIVKPKTMYTDVGNWLFGRVIGIF